VAVTGGQRDELVEARADAILAGVQTAAAYAEHFEAQLDRGPARKLLSSVLRMFRRLGVFLTVILVTCGLLGYAAATVHLAPVVPAGAGQLTVLPGPRGAAAADGSLRVASLRDATNIRIDPAAG
jgi:hypothetical protein